MRVRPKVFKIELYLRDCDFCEYWCMSTVIISYYCPWEFIDCSTAILISELLWMNVLVLLNEYSLPMNWWRIFWWWLFVDRYILSLCKKMGVRPKALKLRSSSGIVRLWGNESMFLYLTGAGFSICVEMLDELTVPWLSWLPLNVSHKLRWKWSVYGRNVNTISLAIEFIEILGSFSPLEIPSIGIMCRDHLTC